MITATVTGNVGKQPESKVTRSGKAMTTFSVASTTKKDGGEPQTTWVDVVCFDEQADVVAQKVNKGDRILVTGRLAVEKFSRKDGTEGQAVRMVAEDVAVSLRFHARGERMVPAGAADDAVIPF